MTNPLTRTQKISLIRKSRLFHSAWYAQTYPDVRALGMGSIEHYVDFGAELGRDPSKNFGIAFDPEAAQAVGPRDNPLVRYIQSGQEGLVITPKAAPDGVDKMRARFRNRMLGLGFGDAPLAEMSELALSPAQPASVRAHLARDIALWQTRNRTTEGYESALFWIARARQEAPDLAFRKRLAALEQVCLFRLDRRAAAEAAYDRAALAGEVDADVILTRTNWRESPESRLAIMNAVLAQYGIPPLRLLPDDGRGLPAYDRLATVETLPPVTEGPKVTVLIAAYDAGATLPTALRALQAQTWRNLEIIVLDDHSPDPATMEVANRFAATDPRIKVVRMPVNAGAYVARNHGLDMATGDYVTLHDADDWAHPLRIETQVRHLEENPDLVACKSRQARCNGDLGFTRWTGDGIFIIENTSSLMFRRAPVREACGYWDTVRFSADSELVRRMQRIFGRDAVRLMDTGPLAFQRDSETSIVADEFLGINGFLFGARKEYYDAQKHFHDAAAPDQLRYADATGAGPRPFPAPVVMRPDRPARDAAPAHIPVVLGTEWRMVGGSVESSLEDLRALTGFGLPTATFQLSRYDLGARLNILETARSEMNRLGTRQLVYGDHVTCDVLLLRYPPALWHDQRYLPRIDAREVHVIVNQPPRSDYGPAGVRRYDLAACQENVRRWFGKEAIWHPIGPLVREALVTHHAKELGAIRLAGRDWHNIIGIDGWDRVPRRPHPAGKLRIGRHSRDSEHKWPTDPAEILAAWPEADDVEIHVLGGSTAPEAVLGRRPRNWTVHAFGEMHPRDFLAGIDIFTYFSHPGWVESFGRTIIEAMASGVPVILPEVYRPLFADAAVYATPALAGETARRLWADKEAYAAQAARARSFVHARFSHDTLRQRLRESGVSGL